MKLHFAAPPLTPSFDAERAAETAEVVADVARYASEVRMKVAVRMLPLTRRAR